MSLTQICREIAEILMKLASLHQMRLEEESALKVHSAMQVVGWVMKIQGSGPLARPGKTVKSSAGYPDLSLGAGKQLPK